jgi:hypothetical protein
MKKHFSVSQRHGYEDRVRQKKELVFTSPHSSFLQLLLQPVHRKLFSTHTLKSVFLCGFCIHILGSPVWKVLQSEQGLMMFLSSFRFLKEAEVQEI